jgi:hypothetical protein
MARTVEVTELALRDGHQSLLVTRMAPEDMGPACADIDDVAGLAVAQLPIRDHPTSSGVSPTSRACAQALPLRRSVCRFVRGAGRFRHIPPDT